MNRPVSEQRFCIHLRMLGLLLGLVLFASNLCSGAAQGTEFNIFKPSPARTRHEVTAVTAYGISMTLFAMGVRPEYAAPIGFAVTTGIERAVHRRNEGMSAGELEMIGTGALFSYVMEKIIQHPLIWRF